MIVKKRRRVCRGDSEEEGCTVARKVEGRMTPVSAAKPAEAKVSVGVVVILIIEMWSS